MESYNEILQLEKLLAVKITAIKDSVVHDIKANTKTPIKPISSTMCTIRLSDLNGWRLDPEYYSPYAQAEHVYNRLKNAETLSEVLARMDDMISTRAIKEGSNTFKLNDYTIKILSSYREDTK